MSPLILALFSPYSLFKKLTQQWEYSSRCLTTQTYISELFFPHTPPVHTRKRKKIFNYSLYSMWVERKKIYSSSSSSSHISQHKKGKHSRGDEGKMKIILRLHIFRFLLFTPAETRKFIISRGGDGHFTYTSIYADVYFTHILYVLSVRYVLFLSFLLSHSLNSIASYELSWFCIHLKSIYIYKFFLYHVK